MRRESLLASAVAFITAAVVRIGLIGAWVVVLLELEAVGARG